MDKICGKWQVTMLDWWLLGVKMPRCFWWWFRNVKIIWQNTDGSIQGCNVLWGWRKWGEFDVFPIDKSCIIGLYGFHYKYFLDVVNLTGNRCRGTLHSWGGERGATFTMTRILPEKAD